MGLENFFTTTLSSSLTDSGLTISLNAVPTATEGYLVIDPDNASKREVIYYTSKGASSVTVPASGGRGADGTSAVAHDSGATVEMNMVAGYWESLQSGEAMSSGSISNSKLSTTSGEIGGAWDAFTPGYTNFSLGNGTLNYADYLQVGKNVYVRWQVTCGSTSSLTGALRLNLPVTATSDYTVETNLIGSGVFNDGGVRYLIVPRIQTTSDISLNVLQASGGYQTMVLLNNTNPAAIASGDVISAHFIYEAA